MRTNRDLILARVGLMVAVFVISALLLAVHLYKVQVQDHAEYLAKAQQRYTTERTTRGKRGEVFDINGHMLVGNKPCATVVADPDLINDPEQINQLADLFASYLNVPREKVFNQLLTKTRNLKREDGTERTIKIRYVVIARQVDIDVATNLKEKVREIKPRLPRAAVYTEEDYIRYYPKGRLLANVLGFTSFSKGKDVAVMGVESSFNQQMMPEMGKMRYEQSRDGRQLQYGNREITKEERDGFNIYLTINEALQAIVEEEMDLMYEKFRPRSACIIMADPKTGNIMALAQRPNFNPNDRSAAAMANTEAWRLLFIENTFEPGSIMKALSISLALDAGVITPNSLFDGEGGTWFYKGKPLTDSSKRNIIPVSVAVQKSSNIVSAKIALKLGEEKLYAGLKKFGIGERTGFPLKPESRGLIAPLKRWDGLAITRVPIGYSVGVTPLQMVRAYCALADGGNLRKLRVFDHAENPATGERFYNPVEPPVRIFERPTTAKEMTDMLKLVTRDGGTAKQAGVPGFEVAGKTGTSRKVINGKYAQGKYNSSFVGYIPADNPAFVLLVTLDEPKGAIYGGITAAPTFRAICERALKYMNINPDPELLEEHNSKKRR